MNIERIKVVKVIEIEYKLNGKTGSRIVRCADNVDSKLAFLNAWDRRKTEHKKLELINLKFSTVTKRMYHEMMNEVHC